MNGNEMVKFLLRSPIHGLLSGSTMLITVTGRKTGRPITLPVNYACDGDTIWVVSSRDRTWWRNVVRGSTVKLNLRGRELEAFAKAVLDETEVAECLGIYVRRFPLSARSLGVHTEGGAPDPQDLARAARQRLVVRIQLRQSLGG